MGNLDHYNLAELGTFIGICGTVLSGILYSTQRSKCKKCCWGCVERDVDAVIAEERLEMTGHTGDTPRKPYLIKEGKELNLEPQPEPEPNN